MAETLGVVPESVTGEKQKPKTKEFGVFRVALELVKKLPEDFWDNHKEAVRLLELRQALYQGGSESGQTMLASVRGVKQAFEKLFEHFCEHNGLKREGLISLPYMGIVKGLDGAKNSELLKGFFKKAEIGQPGEAWELKMALEGRHGLGGRKGVHGLEMVFDPVGATEMQTAKIVGRITRAMAVEYLTNQLEHNSFAPGLRGKVEMILNLIKSSSVPKVATGSHDWGKYVNEDDKVTKRPDSASPVIRFMDRENLRYLDVDLTVVTLPDEEMMKLIRGERVDRIKNVEWKNVTELYNGDDLIEGGNPPIFSVSWGKRRINSIGERGSVKQKACDQVVAGRATGFEVVLDKDEEDRLTGMRTYAAHMAYDGAQSVALTNKLVVEGLGITLENTRRRKLEGKFAGVDCDQEVVFPEAVSADSDEEEKLQGLIGIGEIVTRVHLPDELNKAILEATKKITEEMVSSSRRNEIMMVVKQRLIELSKNDPQLAGWVARLNSDKKIERTLEEMILPQGYNVALISLATQLVGERPVGFCVAPPSDHRLNVGMVGVFDASRYESLLRVVGKAVEGGGLANRGLVMVADEISSMLKILHKDKLIKQDLVDLEKRIWEETAYSQGMMNVFSVMVAMSGGDVTRSILQASGAAVDRDFVNNLVNVWAQTSSMRGRFMFDTAVSGEKPFKLGVGIMDNAVSFRRKVSKGDLIKAARQVLGETEFSKIKSIKDFFDPSSDGVFFYRYRKEEMRNRVLERMAENFRDESFEILLTTLCLAKVVQLPPSQNI